MIFYRLEAPVTEIGAGEIQDTVPTAGYISSTELLSLRERFGFSRETAEACQRANPLFRTGAEVYSDYTFTELRIVNEGGEDDWIAVYLKKNLLLVVDIIDYDGSTRAGFQAAVNHSRSMRLKPERIFGAFLESLIAGSDRGAENLRNTLSEMEEAVVSGKVEQDFNLSLLRIKKKLLKQYHYLDQLLDVATILEENENGIFREEDLVYVTNLSSRLSRLRNDMDSLSNSADHLQDAYSAYLDMKLNHSMHILTVITTIFFPLTIIVGWYGMNFVSIPEFTWKYGYLYVILLSIAVVIALFLLAKKKKWF